MIDACKMAEALGGAGTIRVETTDEVGSIVVDDSGGVSVNIGWKHPLLVSDVEAAFAKAGLIDPEDDAG